MKKIIWIDLDNTPHVLFFRPIIPELRRLGYDVLVTARDAYQVTDVAHLYGIDCKKIGKHYGKNKVLKVVGTLIRSFQLVLTFLPRRPLLAVSHGSRSQVVASKLMCIKSVSIFDYEHAAHSRCTSPTWAMAPEVVVKFFEGTKIRKRIIGYPGIKEDVYVPFFKPEKDIREELGISESKILVLVRPPATEAHYHNPEAELILERLIPYIDNNDAVAVVVPRNHRQQETIELKFKGFTANGSCIIPKNVYDGLTMIWFSDLVVSGGGTMNREAAALGVPVYSIFRGKLGAVDHYLSVEKKLTLIENVGDVELKIKLSHRKKATIDMSSDKKTFNYVVNLIVKLSEMT